MVDPRYTSRLMDTRAVLVTLNKAEAEIVKLRAENQKLWARYNNAWDEGLMLVILLATYATDRASARHLTRSAALTRLIEKRFVRVMGWWQKRYYLTELGKFCAKLAMDNEMGPWKAMIDNE